MNWRRNIPNPIRTSKLSNLYAAAAFVTLIKLQTIFVSCLLTEELGMKVWNKSTDDWEPFPFKYQSKSQLIKMLCFVSQPWTICPVKSSNCVVWVCVFCSGHAKCAVRFAHSLIHSLTQSANYSQKTHNRLYYHGSIDTACVVWCARCSIRLHVRDVYVRAKHSGRTRNRFCRVVCVCVWASGWFAFAKSNDTFGECCVATSRPFSAFIFLNKFILCAVLGWRCHIGFVPARCLRT